MESLPRRPPSASGRSGEHSSRGEPASTDRYVLKKTARRFQGFKAANRPSAPHHVPLLVVLVFDDEDHVKTGQDGGHEVNVVLPLCVVPAAKHRVGCSQHRAARVQRGGDAGLKGVTALVCPVDPCFACCLFTDTDMGITLAMEMVCCSMAS